MIKNSLRTTDSTRSGSIPAAEFPQAAFVGTELFEKMSLMREKVEKVSPAPLSFLLSPFFSYLNRKLALSSPPRPSKECAERQTHQTKYPLPRQLRPWLSLPRLLQSTMILL